MQTEKSKLVDAVFVLVVFATFAGMAVRAVGDEVRALSPSLGAIVSFADVPSARNPVDPDMTVALNVARADGPAGGTCTLNSAVMTGSGGSLFVEAGGGTTDVFRVHWAGGATTDGPADCGRSAELLLNADELRQLAGIVGGFGAPGVRGDDPRADAGVPDVAE